MLTGIDQEDVELVERQAVATEDQVNFSIASKNELVKWCEFINRNFQTELTKIQPQPLIFRNPQAYLENSSLSKPEMLALKKNSINLVNESLLSQQVKDLLISALSCDISEKNRREFQMLGGAFCG